IITNPKTVWDIILDKKDEHPESFLSKLPNDNWALIQSFQQNEMFLLGMAHKDAIGAIKENNKQLLSEYLYRVQKMSIKGNGLVIDIWFRHHLETQLNDGESFKQAKRFYNVQSIGALDKLTPLKVKITNLGNIQLAQARLEDIEATMTLETKTTVE
ncbi:MAG: hypothetical protein K8F30_02115, partial [Taibaiella sp.]|nr:hypothetical protein [Taibaiella sp.]